jgi:transglutaminase-like putative cysteine protease
MQRYKIIHHTYYNFTADVILEPHALRLRPREGHELHIESITLDVTPRAGLLWHRDVEGNSVATATFMSTANQLAIKSEVILQQYNEDPLDFLVSDYAVNYPFSYRVYDSILLAPYMELPDPQTQALLQQWINTIWQSGQPIQTYTLLHRLSTHIHQSLTYQLREEPGVQTPGETLSRGTGSCRDFALLFIEAARCLGLAVRFVSGYLHAPGLGDIAGATHAWAEVYLPGAGWKGFDPTIGEIVGVDHFAVAVARLADSVPPVSGSFSGPPGSSLDVGVWVSKI